MTLPRYLFIAFSRWIYLGHSMNNLWKRLIVITLACSGRVFPPYLRLNRSKPNLTQRNHVSKETHRKIWAPIACVAPRRNESVFLPLHVSPAHSTPPNEKDCWFWRWMTCSFSCGHKLQMDFFTCTRRGSKKWNFQHFAGSYMTEMYCIWVWQKTLQLFVLYL